MTGFWAMLAWNAVLATAMAIAVALAGCFQVVQRRPALRHVLWMLVLLKLITPPLIPLPVLPIDPSGPDVARLDGMRESHENEPLAPRVDDRREANDSLRAESGTIAPGEQPVASPIATGSWFRPVPWPVLVLCVSVCGTVMLVIWITREMFRLSGLMGRAGMGDERLAELARQAASRMGVRNAPEIRLVAGRVTPLIWAGWQRPAIVLPTTLASRLSDEQLLCILCHELAHYVRRDRWANGFAAVVAVLFWWHPVVWWAWREMHLAQESCCDALAIQRSRAARRSYAETLYQAMEFIQAERPLLGGLASAFGLGHSIRRRFEMIANEHLSDRQSWWTWAVVLAVVAMLPCLPVHRTDAVNAAEDAAAAGAQEQRAPSDTWPPGTRVQGRVVDHQGAPVPDAEVLLLGEERIIVDPDRLTHTEPRWPWQRWQSWRWFVIGAGQYPPSARSSQQGRFSLTRENGPANRIAVISRDVLLWEVPRKSIAHADEVLIKLPKPGSIAIRCDLPGKPRWHPVHIELRTFDGANWEPELLRFHMAGSKVENPGETVFDHLPPAQYAVEHVNQTPTGERHILMTPCGRQLVQVEAGKQAIVRFEHKIGRPLKGRVRGLENVELSHAQVTIGYWGPEENPLADGRRSRRLTHFDVIPIQSDGRFSTDPIPPGEYDIDLFAVRSSTPRMSSQSSDFEGRLKVSIPEKGEMPLVEIVAKPRAPRAGS